VAWDPNVSQAQFLRQLDLAGNIVRETNMGVIQHELVARGASDGGPCTAIPSPPPVGAACAGAFHDDAIQTLPNGYTAALIDIEKIFPPGTQGDTSGLPVDIIGEMIIVLDAHWQVVWWAEFEAQLASPAATLGETCGTTTAGCPPIFLLGPGIAPLAHDWLDADSLYYWPAPQNGSSKGNIIMSARNQDLVLNVDYQDGAGTGDILWRMGSRGNFTFNNLYNDPWPWFSHQNDAGIQNGGAGPMTIMDNGNTRVTSLGNACGPYDCDSRGMALSIAYNASAGKGTVTPVVSLDLGAYSSNYGSAELRSDGHSFFENAMVSVPAQNSTFGYSLEIGPAPAAPQAGAAGVLLDMAGPPHYRGWQMPSLYNPPTT
jgi:hypothetical protein